MVTTKIPIAVAEGDGIGPEITQVVLSVLEASKAQLDIHPISLGEKVYLQGHKNGIEPSAWNTLKHVKALLKAPITTPQGGGFKSINVTIRGAFSLYANVRPCISYFPIIQTKHPKMNLVIIRENEEDLYTGIEYQNTPDTVHAIKMITRSGSEQIIRYAFEYAVKHNRKKVTCFTKDNILKLSDGLFHKVFTEIAAEYPQIINEHWIVDIGAAKLADTPESFDVIVMPNLYGDILSDVAAQIAGSVGMAGSANIGLNFAMFEAVHGSAPRRAGQNLANPSGMLQGAILMLYHLGLSDSAMLIKNAWLKTLEDGIHTYDIFNEHSSVEKVGTREFGEAVIQRLGQKPIKFPVEQGHNHTLPIVVKTTPIKSQKSLEGIDVYIEWHGSLEDLLKELQKTQGALKLTMITNRGVKVWPDPMPQTRCVDQWRCRFLGTDILPLLERIMKAGLDIVQTENLYSFDGKSQFSNS